MGDLILQVFQKTEFVCARISVKRPYFAAGGGHCSIYGENPSRPKLICRQDRVVFALFIVFEEKQILPSPARHSLSYKTKFHDSAGRELHATAGTFRCNQGVRRRKGFPVLFYYFIYPRRELGVNAAFIIRKICLCFYNFSDDNEIALGDRSGGVFDFTVYNHPAFLRRLIDYSPTVVMLSS